MLKLLCVVAHPDDEAGCFGGVLAKYSEAGVECSVVCLTAGERAANRGDAVGDEALKAVRRKEFADSCHHLGVGSLPGAGLRRRRPGSRRLSTTLPASSCTPFAPCARTSSSPLEPKALSPPIPTTAWPDCSPPPLSSGPRAPIAITAQLDQGLTLWQARKLYYVTTEFSLQERPAVSLAPVTARIAVGPYIQRKNEAFGKHTSQKPLQPIFEHAQQQSGEDELFHLAATAEVTAMAMETDLFSGIREL